MVFLSEQLKEKITAYVDGNIITRDDVFELWKASNEQQVIVILTRLLEITEEEKLQIWKYIIDDYWKTVDDIFGKNEIILFKTVINCNGIISREEITKTAKIFKNNYGLNNAVDELVEMNILEKVQLSNSKILYILSVKVLEKVRYNGE
jgi:hypothetical protein